MQAGGFFYLSATSRWDAWDGNENRLHFSASVVHASCMKERVNRFLDRVESRVALLSLVFGSSVTGVVAGWISSYSEWVSRFGAVGWILTGLVAAIAFGIMSMCVGFARYIWIKGSVVRKWQEAVDYINPLDDEFSRKRIKISDLADPISNQIRDKTFINCDLIGPANILIVNSNVTGVHFVNCEGIPIKSDVEILTAIVLMNCTISGGRIANATIFAPPQLVPTLQSIGMELKGYTRDELP